MRYQCALLVLLFLATASLGRVHAEDIQLYILAGQSNMDGRGDVSELPDSLNKNHADVQVYYEGSWQPLQPELSDFSGRFGPELTLGRKMADVQPGKTVRLIKVSMGGSPLRRDSTPGEYDWSPLSTDELYDELMASVSAAVSTLPAGTTPHFAGMFWMQGESDTYSKTHALAYQDNLLNFIGSVRSDINTSLPGLGADTMPFSIGVISDSSPWTHGYRVQDAQANIHQSVAATSLVDTGDLNCRPGDPAHYNATGVMILGSRFASAMLGWDRVQVVKQFNEYSQTAFAASGTDLINQGSSALASATHSGYTPYTGTGGDTSSAATLNDGGVGTDSNLNGVAFDADGVWTSIYELDTTSNANGYNLTSVSTITGWFNAKVNQRVEVAYETVDNPGIYFKLRDIADNSSEQGAGKVILTGTGGLLATRVKSVRFSVDFPELDVDDKTVFREFDVEGAATAEASTIQILRQSNSSNEHFYTPRADDLINQGQATLAGAWHVDHAEVYNEVLGQTSDSESLNDGAVGLDSQLSAAAFDGDGIWTSLFELDTSVNAFGYNIAEISTYAGWFNKKINQKYRVYVSTVDSPEDYELLAEVGFDAGASGSSKVTITDSTGLLAGSVKRLRFDFMAPDIDANDMTVLREIDVLGTAIPIIPGDANRDGKVDSEDAVILSMNWLKTGGSLWTDGDFNEDGNVDDADATLLAANWKYGVLNAVPEPSMAALFLTGCGFYWCWLHQRGSISRKRDLHQAIATGA